MTSAQDSPAVGPKSGTGGGARGATVRLAPLARIPQVLSELGFSPEDTLRQVGFSVGFFDDPDLPIPYTVAGNLIAHCVAVTGCEHFGLLLGKRSGPSVLGLTGFLLMNAPDVGTALRNLNRYLDLHDRGGSLIFETSGETCLLGFTVVEAKVAATVQILDLSCVIACNIMRALCGPDWRPTEVFLPHRRPADTRPWLHCFKAPVRFNADRCVLTFPKTWLAQPVPGASHLLHRHLESQASEWRSKLSVSFVDDVCRTVRSTAANAGCNVAHIAQMLGLHERTLNRRLKAQGTSLMRLRDAVLFEMSRQLLGNTPMNLTDLAVALGYADATTFIRAFTRWSGQTPSQWRQHQDRQTTAIHKCL